MIKNRRYLVDTHIFVWWLNGDSRLKTLVREMVSDTRNSVFVSVVSGWEMSIKIKNRKLKLKTSIKRMYEIAGFKVLDVTLDYVLFLEKLPLYHRDPFDRMLIAQAKAENLTLITSDKKIWKYKVDVLRC